jgi:hypothetical protein
MLILVPFISRRTLSASTLMSYSKSCRMPHSTPPHPHSIPPARPKLLQTFTSRVEIKGGNEISRTLEEAETALRYLVETEMVIVDGDVVSTHPRFAHLVDAPERDSSVVLSTRNSPNRS